MMIVGSRIGSAIAAAAVVVVLSAVPISAQPCPGCGGGPGGGWGPGMMMGPGMMGPGGMWGGGMCNPRAAGLAEWRIARINQLVRPTDAQRPKLEELRAASVKAAGIISAACPRDVPQSPVARMELMEKRLNTMLEAIKIVRPAFAAFYDALTPEQQSRVSVAGPRQWGWRRWQQQQQQN